ncbi:MAG: hypothetical protein JXR49_07280 [Acidobacteria bacterium]|nr:hypothetical protein [Acidobacteriota bacterium]
MRYEEFRDRLQIALRDAGLPGQSFIDPKESIELGGMKRKWKVYLVGSSNPDTEPFYVSAKIAFDWNPFDSARSYTCEEDLLTELLGRGKHPSRIRPRLKRVDLVLRANLPWGSTAAVPEPRTFSSWAFSLRQNLDEVFTESRWRGERLVAVLGSLEEVHIDSKLDSTGRLSIEGLSIKGFRMVRVPRIWDDPDRREREKGIETELARLAGKFKFSLDQWKTAISELSRWIRCTPPPDDAKRIAPPLKRKSRDDGGPDTIH